MPTSASRSAGASLMPSPRKPTVWPRALQRLHDARLLRRRQLGEQRRLLDRRVQLRVVHASRCRAPSSDVRRRPGRLRWQILRGDQLVVAGEDLHRDAVVVQRRERRGGRFLGRIEEGDVAAPAIRSALVGHAVLLARLAVHLLVAPPRARAGRPRSGPCCSCSALLAACSSVIGTMLAVDRADVQTDSTSSTAPLQISRSRPSDASWPR